MLHSGQGFHVPETNIREVVTGETFLTCRGLSPWRVNELFILELGRTESLPTEASKEPKRRCGGMATSVVGLTHSRGVGRVMPVESRKIGTLEGVSSLTQREEFYHARH